MTGLDNGTAYRFAVRAEDALGHEDTNTVSLAATPGLTSSFRSIAIDGDFSDWSGIPVIANDPVNGSAVDFADVQVANDSDYLYVRFTLHTAASPFSDYNTHLFLDADANQASGFQVSGGVIGSELMVETGTGYDQRGGGFNEGGINNLGWSASPAGPATSFELRISRTATFANDSAPLLAQDAIQFVLQDNRGETTAAIPYTMASPPPPYSNYAEILVDGNIADWAAIPNALVDPAADGNPDIVAVKVANDADYLYLLVEYAAATDTNTFNGSPSLFLSLDNDANQSTGYDIYGLGQIGAEVSWQNDFPFAQSTGNYSIPASFTNTAAGISPYYANTTHQEYRIPRNATYNLGGPELPVFPQDLIRLAMWSDGASVEFVGGVEYTFADAPPPVVASHYTHIETDGDPSDWDHVPVVFTDPSTDGTPDITTVKVANDDSYLYVLIQYTGAVDTNNSNGSPSTFLSLDNDANPATGFDVYALGEIGAEVSWQNDFAFAQSAGNYNLGATFANAVPGIAPYAANTTFQEYRIPRNATYNLGGPEFQVFPQDLIRLALWSDGAAVEFAGGFNYQFATNPGSSAYQAWKLNRFTAPELLLPLVSGDSADPDHDGVSNFLEFALDLLPKTSDVEGLPDVSQTLIGPDRYLTFTYTRRPSGDGVIYQPQTSSNLIAWNGDPAQFTPVSTSPLGGGFDEITIRLNIPIPTGPKFIRLNASLAP
ncbi:MAG: hypothetical protein Q8Q59_02610 [Luteolibacter sp.]|nr:hypothetical protein [Luteolibacter sp.]